MRYSALPAVITISTALCKMTLVATRAVGGGPIGSDLGQPAETQQFPTLHLSTIWLHSDDGEFHTNFSNGQLQQEASRRIKM